MPKALSIVVPIYNERGAVESTVARFRELARQHPGHIEVIFVDDGSDDGTESALAAAVAGSGALSVIRHAVNRGYGASLKTGISAAAHEYVAITDADGTYPDERFPELFASMREQELDMAVGARTGPGASIPLIRRPPKWCLNKLANFLSGRKIPDLNSGMRIMRKAVVQKFLNILPDGFSFTTTITLAMLTRGYAVGFFPISYRRRVGRSKIRPFYDTLNFLQLICRTTLYFNPLRVFIPLSIALAAAAVAILAASHFFLGQAMDVTFGVLAMTAVMVLAIGLLADLIDKRLP